MKKKKKEIVRNVEYGMKRRTVHTKQRERAGLKTQREISIVLGVEVG